MCPLQSIPVTYTRDRCAYVVDLTLATVESTAFGRQGPEVQILSPRPLTDWFITLSTVANAYFIYDSTGTGPVVVGFLFGPRTQLMRGLTDDVSNEGNYILVSEVFLELNSKNSDRHTQHLTKTATLLKITIGL